MGILLCEQNIREAWIRNKSVWAEIGQLLRTHTHTTAAKLVVRIPMMKHTVQERRLKWYGHVMRREEHYVGRRALVMKVHGRRKRGRPKRR